MYFFGLCILSAFIRFSHCKMFVPNKTALQKIHEGHGIATEVFKLYMDMFQDCYSTSMPNQRFLADNLHSYINAFSKTTVGDAPVFTDNRKFFANMINTAEFKNTLQKDISVLQNNMVEKMKFCDDSIMNENTLKIIYDREVDQTKQ